MDPMIVTRGLTHIFQAGQTEKVALDGVDLAIARGSCAAIIGVTGSGKSTLVQHFNGLLRPTSGTVVVDGVDLTGPEVDFVALRHRVGMLFQFPEGQLFARSVFDDVAFGPRRMRLGRQVVRDRVLAALETVGLPHREYARRSPFDLSGGQMRRIALAGVLAMSPTILVLDEPTTGLDADGRAEFYAYVRRAQLERGVTVILVSHDMAEVSALADWLCVLHAGRLVMQGPPRQIFGQAEQLARWELAVPPLTELILRLREQGSDLPKDIVTVEEAFAVLSKQGDGQRIGSR